MKIKIKLSELNPRKTFLCGQCFRWSEDENGDFSGIVFGKNITVRENGEFAEISGFSEKEAREYFDLETDYAEYIKRLSEDKTLSEACRCSSGIRILRQEPFETLISFIISQNNNIPRISGIIARLCESFGEKIDGGYAFPTAEKMSRLSPDDLAPLRAGFRNRYLVDAAQKVASGEVDLEKCRYCDYDEARAELMKITGVGVKVADCTLLFGLHRIEAFPVDVWMKRAMEKLFPNMKPDDFGEYAGIAQQYIFHYSRMHPELFDS